MTKSNAGSSSGSSVAQLLGNAVSDGTLSPATAAAIDISDIGEQIQQAIGVDVDDVKASEVTLVSQLIDDSGSIRFAGNAQFIRDGHNLVLDALGGSKQREGVLAHCRYLNGRVLYPFGTLDQAVRMNSQNYDPMGGTPLFDQTVVFLASVLAKAQVFEDSGVPCRTLSLLISDSNDEGSRSATAAKCKQVITDMRRTTENHIVAAMGVHDGKGTDFHAIFREMGIPDEWILTPRTPSELRKAFHMFSQSAVRASQGAGSFSQTAAGGFGA